VELFRSGKLAFFPLRFIASAPQVAIRTYAFEGVVTSSFTPVDTWIKTGDPLSGNFSFDARVSNTSQSNDKGIYQGNVDDAFGTSFSLPAGSGNTAIGVVNGVRAPDKVSIAIGNDLTGSGVDSYEVFAETSNHFALVTGLTPGAQWEPVRFSLSLLDYTGSAFSSTDLPLSDFSASGKTITHPNLNAFQAKRFEIVFVDTTHRYKGNFSVAGDITRLVDVTEKPIVKRTSYQMERPSTGAYNSSQPFKEAN
jgi:hypothetical protein